MRSTGWLSACFSGAPTVPPLNVIGGVSWYDSIRNKDMTIIVHFHLAGSGVDPMTSTDFFFCHESGWVPPSGGQQLG
jgi:hypothetical protein